MVDFAKLPGSLDDPSEAPGPEPEVDAPDAAAGDRSPVDAGADPVPPGRVGPEATETPSEPVPSGGQRRIGSVDPSSFPRTRTLGIDREQDAEELQDTENAWGVEFAEGFTRENMLASFIRKNQDRPGELTEDERQRWLAGEFDPLEQIEGTKYEKEQYLSEFAQVRSPRELEWMKGVIDKEERANEMIAQGGTGKAIISGMAGAMFDPIMAPTLAVPAVRASAAARAGYTGATAGALAGVSEYGLHQTQAARTKQESSINIGASALLGSVLGGVMGPRIPKDEAAALHAKVQAEVEGKPVFSPDTTFRPVDEVSDPPLAADEFYHGGTFVPGQSPDRPLFVTKNRDMSESYRGMSMDRAGSGDVSRVRVRLNNPAPQEEVLEAARRAGIDPEEGTPASVFDSEIHGEDAVNSLVEDLRGRGYDHAVMGDVAYGRQIEDDVTVVFPGADTSPGTQGVDVSQMGWNELRRYALENGVSGKGKRTQIEARLKEAGLASRTTEDPAPQPMDPISLRPDDTAPMRPEGSAGAARVEDGTLPPGFRAEIREKVDAGMMTEQEAAKAIRDKQLDWTSLRNEGLFKAFKFGSPILRTALSRSPKARDVVENLIEDSFIRTKNEYGHTSDFAVETIAKSRSHVMENAAHQTVDESYKAYIKATKAGGRARDPRITSKNAFSEEVGKAMARGDKHDIPEVAQAAKSMRSSISDPIERELIREKLIPTDEAGNAKQPVGGDESYFPRVYNWPKIASDRAGFKRHLIERMRKHIREANFKKADNQEKLAEFNDETYQMQLHARLDETIEKILGSPNGYYNKNVVPQTGFLKDRNIRLGFDDLEPYLNTDAVQVQRAYVQNVVPQLEIKKRFSDIDMEEELAEISRDYVKQMEGLEPRSKEMIKMEAERKQVLDDVAAMRDILLHRFERPRNPSSVWNRGGHFIRSANFMRYLGGVTVSSIPDLGQTIARRGLRPVASSFLKLAASPKAMKIGREEAKRMAAGLDAVLHTRANLLMMAAEDSVSPAGKVNRGMDAGVRAFSKATGMAYWNSGLKQFAAIIYADEIGRMAQRTINGKGLKKGEITRLASARISQEDWDLVAREFAKHGSKEGGLYIPNIDQWDPDAKDLFSSALLREVDSAVIAPGAGDLPLMARTPVGKVISQFKSFILTAHNKIFLAGMQRGLLDTKGAADQVAGFMAMMGLGTMAYAMKNLAAGREVETDNYNTIIREALDHSGYFGYLMELNNLTEKTTRGTIGLSSVFGAMGAGEAEPLTRYHTRSVIEDLLGPSVGTATDASLATSAVLNKSLGEEINESDIRAIRRLVPFQNLIYIRRALDSMEQGAADKWAD